MKTLGIVASLVGLTACASGDPVRAPGIEVSDTLSVAGCKYLDTVYGTSGWYGVFAEKGIENARLSAFEKAGYLGASHIVWEPIAQSHGSSQVAAKVYKCPK